MSIVGKVKALVTGEPEPAAPKPIYQKPNTDGRFGSGDVRRLVAFQPLPEHRAPDGTPLPLVERHRLLESDMRETMAVLARRLNDSAMKHSVRGFTWDLDTIEYNVAPIVQERMGGDAKHPKLVKEAAPSVVASLVLRRKR